MECRATKIGYMNKLISVGEIVKWDKKRPLPTWLEEVVVKKEKPVVETDDSPVIKLPLEQAEIPESPVEIIPDIECNIASLRAIAKDMGYKSYHNAGRKKLEEYIAKHDK